jgi:hypothetical protein
MDAVEFELYRHCLSDDEHLEYMLSILSGINVITTRNGAKIRIKARRMSGEMNTSLGNGFTNLMIIKFFVHEYNRGHANKIKIDGIVEGDDGLFVILGDVSSDTISEFYERLGFLLKVEQIPDPCKASFCGLTFPESGQVVRDPRRFVQKFGWTGSMVNGGPKLMDALLRAKALSAIYETPHCPIVGVLARRALDLTRDVSPRFVRDGFHDIPDEVNVPEFSPLADTRELFAEKFHVNLETQLLIEDAIRRGNMARVAELMPPPGWQDWYAQRFLSIGKSL